MGKCTEAVFLKDVAEHKMTALLDNGIHRHLRFAKVGKNDWNMHFNITTWPGYLCITGDTGCFVFTRIPDMFNFFRTAPEKTNLYINPQYWSEKCEAADKRTGGVDEFSHDEFEKRVWARFDEHEFDSDEEKETCREAIRDEVLGAENEYEAFGNASRFESEGFDLADFWECNLRDYNYHFIWCCYAIAWGIRQYDSVLTPATSRADTATELDGARKE